MRSFSLLLSIMCLLLLSACSSATAPTTEDGSGDRVMMDENEDNEENVQTGEQVTLEGTVTATDMTQAMVDGPYIVQMETEAGASYTIAVPSMGILLCAARDNIADVSTIEVGMHVAVQGMETETGIVPCENETDYLRVQ